MQSRTCLRAVLAGLLLLGTALAQSTGASAPAPPPDPPSAFKLGPVTLSGLADGYYSYNFNDPANGINQLRAFDDYANQPTLNLAKMTLDYTPQPVGMHLDVGFGRAIDVMAATENDPRFMRNFEQAYVDVRPASWKGAELDFGKFVTTAGAEVIETVGNYNYSRSLLFTWAIPFYHFGARFSIPVTKQFTAGAQLVAGWNNIVTGATYKTVGLTGTWTRSKFAWTNTWYGGPDENTADRGYRNLYDTVFTVTTNSKTSMYLNFDYLRDAPRAGPAFHVAGIAGAARFQMSKKISLSPRLEYLSDPQGGATGTPQHLKEATLTGSYALETRLLAYLEYRYDWSNQPFFTRGHQPGNWKDQPTLLFGMVLLVRPKQ